ncbi:hypothetical protein [Terrabacter ginsenosidimutans]|uniref:hypothetical protein n=1 Tax=Terrabacter ginsenosidimutans TaxID=490575 RepID=UPI0031F13128
MFLHRIRFQDVVEPGPATQALSCFIEPAVVTLSGSEPDGRGWGALFQYVRWPRLPRRVPLRAQLLAAAGFARALHLTGLAGEVVHQNYGEATLRQWYSPSIHSVETWPAMDLLSGLVLELATNVPLEDLARQANDLSLDGSDVHEYREAHFAHLLREWASTYEGPGAH